LLVMHALCPSFQPPECHSRSFCLSDSNCRSVSMRSPDPCNH